MYLQNKYTKCYYSIINRAKSRELPKEIYTEKHHTIPKSLVGIIFAAVILLPEGIAAVNAARAALPPQPPPSTAAVEGLDNLSWTAVHQRWVEATGKKAKNKSKAEMIAEIRGSQAPRRSTGVGPNRGSGRGRASASVGGGSGSQ